MAVTTRVENAKLEGSSSVREAVRWTLVKVPKASMWITMWRCGIGRAITFDGLLPIFRQADTNELGEISYLKVRYVKYTEHNDLPEML